MTDDQRARRINEAAERFAESLIEAYRSVAGRSVSTQELNAHLTQGFFDRVIDNLGSHAEGNRVLTEKLIKQQRKQQEASRTLAWESVDAYMDLLGSVFALPHRGVQTAGRAAQEASPGSSVEPGGEESEAQRDVARHPLSSWMKDSPGAPG